jgi:hypothetical protein
MKELGKVWFDALHPLIPDDMAMDDFMSEFGALVEVFLLTYKEQNEFMAACWLKTLINKVGFTTPFPPEMNNG